jgi:hypothetical protein
MALIIESGEGLSNATSYIDIAYADAYFLARGITTWTGTDAVKENYTVLAMSYIEAVYSESWKGDLLLDTQSLSFPRVIDGDTVYPDRLKNSVCELALKAIDGALLVDLEQRTVEEQVGSIKVKYSEYADQKTQYSLVYNLVKPYLLGYGSTAKKVLRA